MNKKKRLQCRKHYSKGRGWDDYVFSYTRNEVDYYYCKPCWEYNEQWLAKRKIIEERERVQKEEAFQRWMLKTEQRRQERERRSKEDLWDCVVRKELLKGIKNSWKIEVPKELLQLKRASMKLERLINEKKKGIRDKKEEFKGKLKKLNEHLLICKKHGYIYLKDAIKSGKSRWTGEQKYKCQKCMKDLHNQYYEKKKEYLARKHAEYREKNKEKLIKSKADYWRRMRDKNNEHEDIKG